MPKMSKQTSKLISAVIGIFILALIGSVLHFLLQQLNSSGLQIPSNVNVFQYVYPMHLPTPEEAEIIVVVFVIIISLIILIKRRIVDEDWDW